MAVRKRPSDYQENSIRVLKGLEPVKSRPGMYTLTDNPLHIIQEVLDNASDEVLGGFGDTITLTMCADGSVAVEDNGRGIPVGIHPTEGIPTVELVFTQLHAGGKFDKASGGAYSFSGGLHGVGVSVTNALSRHLNVTVWRDGKQYDIGFADGFVSEPLTEQPSSRGKKYTGTRVQCLPDPKYFDSPTIPEQQLIGLLQSKAVLLPRCTVRYINEKTGQELSWRYDGGLREYLFAEFTEPLLFDPFEAQGWAEENDETFAVDEGAHWVVCWSETGTPVRESYVNLIPTPAGGTHEAGLREGLFLALKFFMDAHGLMAKGVKLLTDDVASRASFVLSAKVLDPQFQGQTKEKLTSRDAMRLVSNFVRPQFEYWLNDHIEEGKKLAELVIRQAQARQRRAQKVEKKKSSSVAVLPGKLTDCESTDISRNEIFLVEGDSAGGTAKSGRDRNFQAIMPLRGKILNIEKAQEHRMWENEEIKNMFTALGVTIGTEEDSKALNLEKLRYDKIIIMTDADVDGSHIATLMLTFFFRKMKELIENGHVYIATPPLYLVKKGKQERYCWTEKERDTITAEFGKGAHVQRYKGLGEMNAHQLWETTMNPDTRILRQVNIENAAEADRIFSMLMGDEVPPRREFIEKNAHYANIDA